MVQGREWGGSFSGDTNPRLHVTAFTPALTSPWMWSQSDNNNPKFKGSGRPLVLTGSSQSQGTGSKSHLDYAHQPVSTGHLSRSSPPTLAPSTTSSHDDAYGCEHCQCLPQETLPCAWGAFPARCQGLVAPRHRGKALSCHQGKYSSWSFCLRHPSLCCPDHVSRVWGRKKDQ